MKLAVLVFDVDGTLARSKQPIEATMAVQLTHLLLHTKVALISGDPFKILTSNIVEKLASDTPLENLYLMPTSGSALFTYKNGVWEKIYEEALSRAEAAAIEAAIGTACAETGIVDLAAEAYGEHIENRGTQITLSALGQEAPIDAKEAWDPTREKREKLHHAIAQKLPDFDVKIGGSTSIDITKHGVNKAYGVKKLAEYLSLPISDMLYIGDALYPGGNDEVVKESGIVTRSVQNPGETEQVIEELLKEPS